MRQSVAMRFVLCSLLLSSLWTRSCWRVSSSAILEVTQSPANITVRKGETVELRCCWSAFVSQSRPQVRVTWTEPGTQRDHKDIIQNRSHTCDNLTLLKVTAEHSGTYVCEVTIEIPTFQRARGNGSTVTVIPADSIGEDRTQTDPTVQTVSPEAVVPGLVCALALIMLLIGILIYYRRLKQAPRVIYEVPNMDSEVVDKHSCGGSSRGSSEWCQVQLYESIDYFERVDTEKRK